MSWIIRIIKSKTLLFSLLLAILGVVEASTQVFAAYMTPEAFGWFCMAVSAIVAVLRILTTQSVSDK